MDVGDRIKAARLAAGLTQVQLAALLKLDKSAVGAWEAPNNRAGITVRNLIRVAAILGVKVSDLTGEPVDEPDFKLTNRDEITLVSLFRGMPGLKQRVILDLFRTDAIVSHSIDLKHDPQQRTRVAS